jgi:SMI1 / KNR4 family (SUKH-1)
VNAADLVLAMDMKQPPVTADEHAAFTAALTEFETAIGAALPTDYREFLGQCNGGYIGGALWYKGPTPEGIAADAGVHHLGGFRTEWHFSLPEHRECYDGRIPAELVWIMDDPFGNAICLGLSGTRRGCMYFWDHEREPDDGWDGTFETAGNIQLLANSFTEFVAGLRANE